MQGHQDSPLTPLGVEQAVRLGEALRNERIDAFYASPSSRACRTAELIRGIRAADVVTAEALKEIGLGIWEGLAQSEVEARFPEQFGRFWNDPEAFGVSGSETFADVAARAVRQVNRILDEHRGRSILIVTHTVVVKLVMAYFEGRAMKDIWQPPYIHPSCLSKIVIGEGRSDIVLHGDMSHFADESRLLGTD